MCKNGSEILANASISVFFASANLKAPDGRMEASLQPIALSPSAHLRCSAVFICWRRCSACYACAVMYCLHAARRRDKRVSRSPAVSEARRCLLQALSLASRHSRTSALSEAFRNSWVALTDFPDFLSHARRPELLIK